jgi:nucleoside-diphosphate-sugar epimerase
MNIAIIGCGYIGSMLASLWSKMGHHVTATTRKTERLEELSKVAQKGVILKGNDPDEFIPLITHNELILVTTAADSPEHYESAYLNTAQILKNLALEMDLPRDLIYTSSTAVYGDQQGQWVSEESPLLGTGDQTKVLVEAEKTYLGLEEIGWSVCIFRLAEIYGPGREISRRVSQSPFPGTGEKFTNMVHAEDCVGAIQFALKHHLEGVYNVADDDHMTRKEMYDALCKKLSLPEVSWDPTLQSRHPGNRRVSNHKIKKEGFEFTHPQRVFC